MLIKLMQGVRRFKNEPFKQMKPIFEHLGAGQHPTVLFITCSDSRVIPSLFTQSMPGDLFVIRNVGNIIPPFPTPASEAAALEYAVNVLKIKDIIVCGHSDCGAIKGLFTPNLENQLPSVAAWLTHSQPLCKEVALESEEKISLTLARAIKENVLLQLKHLESYPMVAEKLARNELTLHGWVYEFGTGEVFVYEPQKKNFISLDKALKLTIEARRDRIVINSAMRYLAQHVCPKTVKDYVSARELLFQLREGLEAIWPFIKKTVREELWEELDGLYTSSCDSEFIELVESGRTLSLTHLNDFQKSIQQSPGYQKFCSQLIRRHGFSATVLENPEQTEDRMLLTL